MARSVLHAVVRAKFKSYSSMPTRTNGTTNFFGSKTSEVLYNFRYQAADAQGYVNLRCSLDTGCPTSANPRHPSLQDARHKDVRLYLADIYMYLFQVPYESVPEHIGGVCCAQFVVSRKQVLKRPKADYERMLSWVAGTRTTDSFGVGWVMEKVWHVVFGMEPVYCPSFNQCRCDNFGRCEA
ncbi:hypothetical protein MGYG_02128 [Nannizzia gypsea CBS 118893]|uniref:Uncharacterized protein n=1 Tax=Arthroderma gypseum (strain ATCC MYA-4604 / CBS 118893) TaxID=535722 RepID=E4UPY1_ARTGP|nr:hypothetical protein MGYG_02128 [Nannizzia gypsea CBS 118893]EFQ99115.1 hypothetical protein MGYG_02128 [Nannizzia gypsea CBS 118893]